MKRKYSTWKGEIPAHSSVEIVRLAGYVVCLGASAPFKLSIDGNPPDHFEAGLGVSVQDEFQRVELSNDTGANVTVEMAFADDVVFDNRMVMSGAVAVSCGGASFLDKFVDVGGEPILLLAANGKRTSAILRAGDAPVCLGANGSVTYAEPATIGAGQSLTIAHKGAVWGVRQSGTAKVGVYEETA